MDAITPHPGWRNALSILIREGKTYGDVLTFEWLYEAFAIVRPGDNTANKDAERSRLAFLSQFDRLRDEMLEEHQMDLRSERAQGYLIVPPTEQTKLAEVDLRIEMRRALRRAGGRLTNVNLTMLSAREKQQNADAVARLSSLRSKTKEVLAIGKKPACP